jgi:hypothetical protein
LLISLNNCEGTGILDVLHHKPGNGFLVLGVDPASLDELGRKLIDALLVILGVEVNDDCVDHDG